MRTLRDLNPDGESAWPRIQEQLRGAAVSIEILPREPRRADEALVGLQITTRSPLGALVRETGGVLIDHGWVRLFGGGCERLPDSVCSMREKPYAPRDALIVGFDAIGGLFALDGGAFGVGDGRAHYCAPDSLRWEPLHLAYGELLRLLASEETDRFYRGLRWPGWEHEVATLAPDRGLLLYPPPWSKEGKEVGAADRRAVPMDELLAFQLDMGVALGR